VLVIGCDASAGFTFRHADDRVYGSTLVVPHRAQAFANAEGTLRSMGFESREAREMVDAIRGERRRRRERRGGAPRRALRRAEPPARVPRLGVDSDLRTRCRRPPLVDSSRGRVPDVATHVSRSALRRRSLQRSARIRRSRALHSARCSPRSRSRTIARCTRSP
jgi:hypothetical protein